MAALSGDEAETLARLQAKLAAPDEEPAAEELEDAAEALEDAAEELEEAAEELEDAGAAEEPPTASEVVQIIDAETRHDVAVIDAEAAASRELEETRHENILEELENQEPEVIIVEEPAPDTDPEPSHRFFRPLFSR